jgi:hypothetical protein
MENSLPLASLFHAAALQTTHVENCARERTCLHFLTYPEADRLSTEGWYSRKSCQLYEGWIKLWLLIAILLSCVPVF